MFDTYKARIVGDWKRGLLPSDWTRYETTRKVVGEETVKDRADVMLIHESTGLRVIGSQDCPAYVEASLPRLVLPSNAYVLEDQDQVDAATARLWEVAGEVCDRPAFRALHRLDLVQQFPGEPGKWVGALQDVRWPLSRKSPCVYPRESIAWRGRSATLRIYDKGFESYNRRGLDVVRVEAQCNRSMFRATKEDSGPEMLARLMLKDGNSANPGTLDLRNGYALYRSLVVQLPPFQVARPKVNSLFDLVAYMVSTGQRINGVRADEWIMEGRSKRTKFRYAKKLSEAQLRQAVDVVDLASLLPEDRLPQAVHCVPA